MGKGLSFSLWGLLLAFHLSVPSLAETRYSSVYQKSNAKAASRWSLDEWLEQRDKMRLMDLWLSLHSPSPFEFFLTANYQWGRQGGENYYTAWNLGFAAYATIFGVEVNRELSDLSTRTTGIFNLRIFGQAVQGLNLTLQGGAKYEERGSDKFWTPLAGFFVTIYVNRYFGFEFLYRHHLKTDLKPFYGNRYEGDVFIDFKFLRVFGGYFYEGEKATGSADFIRKGGFLGTKFFF